MTLAHAHKALEGGCYYYLNFADKNQIQRREMANITHVLTLWRSQDSILGRGWTGSYDWFIRTYFSVSHSNTWLAHDGAVGPGQQQLGDLGLCGWRKQQEGAQDALCTPKGKDTEWLCSSYAGQGPLGLLFKPWPLVPLILTACACPLLPYMGSE